MKLEIYRWVVLIIFIWNLSLKAETCDESKEIKNLSISKGTSKWNGCVLRTNISDELRERFEGRDRGYTFDKNGLLMVFIGTNDYDRFSKSTGSRCLHFLPVLKQGTPSFVDLGDGKVEAILPSGHKAHFSTETGDLLWVEGYKVQTSPIEHMDKMVKKQGGIDITPEKGSLLFDYGWRTGEMSVSQLWRKSVIYDGYGNKCNIKNKDVFKKDPRDSDEVVFRYDSQAKLEAFLKKKCKKIRIH
ncbi:MAG: hypothetical protein KDK54_12070 [Leptospiraceae bacterium]|nr:hypothetical protein [Leptospiraceae bacterium]